VIWTMIQEGETRTYKAGEPMPYFVQMVRPWFGVPRWWRYLPAWLIWRWPVLRFTDDVEVWMDLPRRLICVHYPHGRRSETTWAIWGPEASGFAFRGGCSLLLSESVWSESAWSTHWDFDGAWPPHTQPPPPTWPEGYVGPGVAKIDTFRFACREEAEASS
jgi:hypothetical protein